MRASGWIDRAARAICKSEGRTWNVLREAQRAAYRAHARAAISALRYQDGVDEEAAVLAGRAIGADAVIAIDCLENWISASLVDPRP